jgi:multidrug efflux pump subunit AcrB/ABC-type multidrug transport system ATPase subunit
MNPLRTIIHRKVGVGMLLLALCLLGVVSYQSLPLELMPAVNYPMLVIQVTADTEMNPDYLEREAVLPLEGAAGAMGDVAEIVSSIDRRRATITLMYEPDVDGDIAYLKLLERVNTVIPDLDESFRVQVVKVDTERLTNLAMRLQVRGSGGLDRVRSITDESIVRELEAVDGVAMVDVTGGTVLSVEIALDADVAKAYNITPGFARSLITRNAGDTRFAGHAYDNGKQYFVNVVSDYTEVSQLSSIVVSTVGPVYLGDIADITFGEKDQDTISRVNGLDAITVQIIRDPDINMIDLSHELRDVIERQNLDLASQDVEIVIQTDMSEEMESTIDSIMWLALTGGLLAVFILWLFLRNLRLVLVVLLSMPVSILAALNIFYAAGISINSLTLVGIALAVGMLLDNSVVVLESIYRQVALGRERGDAVVRGTGEVWRSITAATFTTVTVFLPFVFSSEVLVRTIGQHVGVSIIATLLVSLFVALTLIPAGAHLLLGVARRTPASFTAVSHRNRPVQIYTLLLKTAMRNPAMTIASAVGVFFVSVGVCLALSLDVSREVDLREFTLYVTMPQGATLDRTDEAVADIEAMISDVAEIQDVVSTIYEDEATISVVLSEDYEDIDGRSIAEVKEGVEDQVDEFRLADVSLSEPQASGRFGGGGGSNPLASLDRLFGIGASRERLVVKGGDYEVISGIAEDLQYYIEELDTVSRTGSSTSGERPEVHLLLDRQVMSMHDIPLTEVTSELASFESEITTGVAFRQGSDEYDITIRTADPEADEDTEPSFADLADLQVLSRTGAAYDLERLGEIMFSGGKSSIDRVNQEKQIEVTYQFEDDIIESTASLDAAREDVEAIVAAIQLPPGVAVEIVEDESGLTEFQMLIGAAAILIFMILASVFESLSLPVVMMFTIPLAAIGSLWALILTGNSLFNANALIGFLILLGVVVNNGIILIDYTHILRRRGFRTVRALMAAGRARVRPILITAITTIVAMIPLALGNAEYVARIGAPFAITVIGGLALSTVFTLVFIPTAYLAMESALKWIGGLSLRIKIVQAVVFALLAALIYFRVESLLWQSVSLCLSVAGVPGLTWFALTSLRQAKGSVIPVGQALVVAIRRLVKVYDTDSRFVREWKKEQRMEDVFGSVETHTGWRDFDALMWQVPLLGFLLWFTYGYLDVGIWMVIWSVISYLFTLMMWRPIAGFLEHRTKTTGSRWYGVVAGRVGLALAWCIPLVNLPIFHEREFPVPVTVFVGVAWYAVLIVIVTADRLHRENINIMRLTGRFAGLRRMFYSLVGIVPVIGRRKRPFAALDGISLEIESGMFGLLGPNGAGKTTLMRIICGIMDAGMGTVRFGDLRATEHREELQGLIGYLPQEFGAYENMSAYEFLDYLAILKGIIGTGERRERVMYALGAVHLTDRMDRRIGSFSGGMKQRMGIALTLLHLPRVLVVDEPTAGLDPRERIRFRNLLVELSRDRIVIFSTHIIEDISSSCNRLAVIVRGELRYLGGPREMNDAARGRVWQFDVSEQEFDDIRTRLVVVHHMRVGDLIRVRCISAEMPHPGAEHADPTLEDAYLWHLGGAAQLNEGARA